MDRSNGEDFIRGRNFLIFATSLILVVWMCFPFSLAANPAFILDGQEYIIGRDFFNVWAGAKNTIGGTETLYNSDLHNQRISEILGQDYRPQKFSYPPHVLLLLYPFSLLPYNVAYLLFSAIGLTAFWKAVKNTVDHQHSQWAIMFAPALLLCLLVGQYSMIMAAIFITLYRKMDAAPILCGILIALLTIKPQIGILLPIFLLVTRRYKVFCIAAIASLIFLGISLLVHGLDSWVDYFAFSREQVEVTSGLPRFSQGLLPTMTVQLRSLGFTLNQSMLVQGLIALPAIGFMIWVCLRSKDKFIKFAVFIVTVIVSTPYLMAYDTLIVVWVMVLATHQTKLSVWHKLTYIWVAILPLAGGFLMGYTGINGVWGLLALAIWIYLLAYKNIKQQPQPVS